MKYQINNLKVNPKDLNNLEKIIKSKLKINNFTYKIISKSIDARDKENVVVIFKLLIETEEHPKYKDMSLYEKKEINIEYPKWKDLNPVIVGFGPAGMFAALYLARCGANPIIIERGKKIEDRKKDVLLFLNEKKLDENSNVQYGEGGAGAFSDGKLTTNLKNPLISFILEEFHKHGAKEDILYDSKPHIGTDYLEIIVRNIRLEIEKLGGKFYFSTRFIDAKRIDNDLYAVIENDNKIEIRTNHILLGIGHSAKDTIRHLYNNMNVNMEQKAFSMGVRIEHLKDKINEAQYGKYKDYLPAAYYNLSAHDENNRGVYTFCMCPGGYVLASTSDNNTIAVNGMSNNDRGNVNSNSALLVDVRPSDYDNGNVLDGIDYQEKYEKLAFNASKDYRAPSNLVKEFLNNEIATSERSIKSSYPHGLNMCNLNTVLPDYVIDGLKFGIKSFSKKLKGFDDPDAVLVGIESRSSSPVRILRDENMESSFKGIYPMGEGAGYAGGITSAALDGLKVAMKIIK